MAAGDIKNVYAAGAAITQTNLDGIASSATLVAGWESGEIDNSANLYTDYIISGKFQVESAGLGSNGEIRMYVVPERADGTWPDVFDGTESTETITDTEIRDAICRLIAITSTDGTASRVYELHCPSLKKVLGEIPRKFVIFVTQSSGAALETTGDPNQVYVQGLYKKVSQS